MVNSGRNHDPAVTGRNAQTAANRTICYRYRIGRLIEQHIRELGSTESFEHALTAILHGMMNGTMPTLSALSASCRNVCTDPAAPSCDGEHQFPAAFARGLASEADEYLTDGRLSQSEIASFWDIRRRGRSAAPIDLGQV